MKVKTVKGKKKKNFKVKQKQNGEEKEPDCNVSLTFRGSFFSISVCFQVGIVSWRILTEYH